MGESAPMNAIHRLVGMGGDQLVPRLMGRDVPGASEAKSAHYQQLYDDIVAFEGASELLEMVHDAGLAVVLATSSGPEDLEVSIKALGGIQAVDAITTKADVERSKPAPDVFLAALQSADIDPRRALVVGDSVWDIEAARAAGLGCIGVESGGFGKHELDEAGAIQVYRDVAELGRQMLTSPIAWLLH